MAMEGPTVVVLVALSVTASVAACHAALWFIERMVAARSGALGLAGAAALSLGAALAMVHVIGLRAVPHAMPELDPLPVAGAVLLPVATTVAALLILARGAVTRTTVSVTGAIVGLGMVAMHYVVTSAPHADTALRHDPVLLALAAAVAVCGTVGGLWLTLLSAPAAAGRWTRVAGSVALGLSLVAVHQIGLAGAEVLPQDAATAGISVAEAAGIAAVVAALAFLLFAGGALAARPSWVRARQMEEARYRALVDTAVDPIVTIDRHGIIQTFNRAAETTFGYAAAEAVGRNVAMLMPEPDRKRHDSYLERYHTSGERKIIGIGREVEGLRRDGTTFPLDLSVAEWMHDGTPFYTGIMRDISDRKQGEERLRLLMREVDHRAKNALAVVQAIVRLSRADDPALYARTVEGRIAAIARAHSLLAASHWAGADLHRLIEGEVGAFDTGGVLRLKGPAVSIRAEATQALSMVLHELATNAAKYGALSHPGGRLAVEWDRVDDAHGLSLTWTETAGPPVAGPPTRHGFGEKLLDSMVENQLRARIAREWRPEGLWLHLDLPGDTWRPEGTVPHQAEIVQPTPEPRAAPRRLQVLVVEDEALTALALKEMLEDAGYTVLGPAGRVADALDLVRAQRPDVALLDVNLFGETVEPVAATLLRLSVPFAFCTGYQDVELNDLKASAIVLQKPVNSNVILETLGTLAG